VVEYGVTIIGSVNLPAEIPHHASQMYSKNNKTFFLYVCKNGQIALDSEDEIIRDTLVARGGQVVHAMLREPAGQPSQ